MATILEVARLKGLLTEARRCPNEAAQRKLVADNKEFIERMTAEYKAKFGNLPPEMAAIARQFGIEH